MSGDGCFRRWKVEQVRVDLYTFRFVLHSENIHHRVSAVFVSTFHCCFVGMLAPIVVQRACSLFLNLSSWIVSLLMGWSSRGLVACLLCVACIRDDDVRQKKTKPCVTLYDIVDYLFRLSHSYNYKRIACKSSNHLRMSAVPPCEYIVARPFFLKS